MAGRIGIPEFDHLRESEDDSFHGCLDFPERVQFFPVPG